MELTAPDRWSQLHCQTTHRLLSLTDLGSPGMAVDFTMPLRIGQLEEGISIYPNPE